MPALLRPIVVHQAGSGNSALVSNLYEQFGIEAQVVEFFDDMATQYALCDLVISRAGALSVSEIATAGVASILIPYPFAVDDHQRVNASHLENIGASLLLDEEDLTADHLSNLLSTLTRERLRDMACSAQQYSSAKAVDDMCARLEEMFR
jgi:UDP-N-acetylglucosamine--N-acetylmuramyl-(pentapeptide) pyrophosphoryl-undecaprenol N-acetylglucosamine transferase